LATAASWSATADPLAPALDDLKWIDPAADRVAVLTRVAPECIAGGDETALAAQVALGRIAFRSPALLGGIAARSGMSCNTCHRNGHGNSAFFVAGVSGDPGTVDVTGAIFSRERDDGAFNPVPIPSLVDAAAKPPFGSVTPKDDLADFVTAVVVDEFQGLLPTNAVSEGLLAYLRALRSSACPPRADEEVGLEGDASDLEASYDAIDHALEHGDAATAEFALLSLKAGLGRIHQRFPPGEKSAEGLVRVSMALTPIRSLLETRPADARLALARTRGALKPVIDDLLASSSRSLYDPAVLEHALRNGH